MEPRYEHYRSFLLRIWRSGENRSASWRVSLVDPITGKQVGFTNMEALISYVQEIIAAESTAQGTTPEEKAP